MPFIEMTGKTLDQIITEGELHHEDLLAAGVTDTTIVRVNRVGDIEVRRSEGWDVIGGLDSNGPESLLKWDESQPYNARRPRPISRLNSTSTVPVRHKSRPASDS